MKTIKPDRSVNLKYSNITVDFLEDIHSFSKDKLDLYNLFKSYWDKFNVAIKCKFDLPVYDPRYEGTGYIATLEENLQGKFYSLLVEEEKKMCIVFYPRPPHGTSGKVIEEYYFKKEDIIILGALYHEDTEVYLPFKMTINNPIALVSSDGYENHCNQNQPTENTRKYAIGVAKNINEFNIAEDDPDRESMHYILSLFVRDLEYNINSLGDDDGFNLMDEKAFDEFIQMFEEGHRDILRNGEFKTSIRTKEIEQNLNGKILNIYVLKSTTDEPSKNVAYLLVQAHVKENF